MKISRTPSDRAAAYARIVAALAVEPGVRVGTGRGKGFGQSALTVRGKIFAMLASGDRFVVKLPRFRVDALVTAGTGRRFEPARGRVMREWCVVEADSARTWLELAREAHAFVTDSK